MSSKCPKCQVSPRHKDTTVRLESEALTAQNISELLSKGRMDVSVRFKVTGAPGRSTRRIISMINRLHKPNISLIEN